MSTRANLSRRQFLGQASCAAVSAVPLMSTLLNLRLAGRLAAASAPGPDEYRALVCVFLNGGNDSFNMLVPTDPAGYAAYAAARADLALPLASLLPIQPVGLGSFGLHPGLAGIRDLFAGGQAALLTNVGTLIERVTSRSEVDQHLKQLPLGLYSHSDQIEQWQTSVPHARSGIGWAGRVADLLRDLNVDQTVPMNISLDGSNVFQTGNVVAEYTITTAGAVSLVPYNPAFDAGESDRFRQAVSAAVDSQLTQTYANLLQQTLNTRKREAVDAYARYAAATANPLPAGVTFPDTHLGRRLARVARTVQGRDGLGARRQTFFVSWGGWDHHDEVVDNQAAMLPQVSEAISAFQAAMVAIGMSEHVTLFTASDFGRTLTSNGRGSDHAWGGHQLVVGGAVQGGRLYGTYPSLLLNPESGPQVNPLDVGRGRFIPTTSVDEFFAELAMWLGVSRTDLPYVLPNINSFHDPASAAPPLGFLLT